MGIILHWNRCRRGGRPPTRPLRKGEYHKVPRQGIRNSGQTRRAGTVDNGHVSAVLKRPDDQASPRRNNADNRRRTVCGSIHSGNITRAVRLRGSPGPVKIDPAGFAFVPTGAPPAGCENCACPDHPA